MEIIDNWNMNWGRLPNSLPPAQASKKNSTRVTG